MNLTYFTGKIHQMKMNTVIDANKMHIYIALAVQMPDYAVIFFLLPSEKLFITITKIPGTDEHPMMSTVVIK